MPQQPWAFLQEGRWGARQGDRSRGLVPEGHLGVTRPGPASGGGVRAQLSRPLPYKLPSSSAQALATPPGRGGASGVDCRVVFTPCWSLPKLALAKPQDALAQRDPGECGAQVSARPVERNSLFAYRRGKRSEGENLTRSRTTWEN